MLKHFALFALLIVLTLSCEDSREMDENGNPYPDMQLTTFEERLSYGLGADWGASLQSIPEEMYNLFNRLELENGFVSGLNHTVEDRPECDSILQNALSSGMIDTTTADMYSVSNCYGFILGDLMRKSLESKDALSVVDLDIAKKGFAHSLYQIDTLIDLQERGKMIADFYNDMNKKKSEALMEKAKSFENAIIGPSGYVLIQEKEGTGEQVNPEMEYLMVFTMINANGDTLMSTISDLEADNSTNALDIKGSDVVDGWKMATSNMKLGGKYTVYLPYDLAYGENGLPNPRGNGYYIEPFSALIISSEVLDQQPPNTFAIERGEKIIAEAKAKSNVFVGKSGFVLETIKEGTGPKIKPGSDVQAQYVLINSRGEQLENSYMASMQGRPAPAFSLNGVIQGWQEGVPEMKKGGKYRLYVPYNLAYGETGNQGIPPYETLTFEMEILEVGEPGTLVKPNPMGGM